MLTLYVQGGVQTSLSDAGFGPADTGARAYTGWFLRGVARYYVNDNLRLEGWGMYAAGRGGEEFRPVNIGLFGNEFRARHTAWGAGIEHKLQTMPFSFFLRYEGSWTQLQGVDTTPPVFENGYTFRTAQHGVRGGFRVYLNENTLRYNDRMGTTLDIRDGFTSTVRGLGRTIVGGGIM